MEGCAGAVEVRRTSLQVQHQVEYLFKKLHEQDKNIIFSVFPEVLRSLCESPTLQLKEKERILGVLSPYVTGDKQNRSLIENILGRMMVELKDVEAAKFCLHGVKLFKSGAETSASIVKAISSVSLPMLSEKLEDEEFAKLLLVCSLRGYALCWCSECSMCVGDRQLVRWRCAGDHQQSVQTIQGGS